jgi:hypothetical protein
MYSSFSDLVEKREDQERSPGGAQQLGRDPVERHAPHRPQGEVAFDSAIRRDALCFLDPDCRGHTFPPLVEIVPVLGSTIRVD